MKDEITLKLLSKLGLFGLNNLLNRLELFGLRSDLDCNWGYSFEEPYRLESPTKNKSFVCQYANIKENSLLELIRSALTNKIGKLEKKVKFFRYDKGAPIHDEKPVDRISERDDIGNYQIGLGIGTLQAELRLTQTQKSLVIASFDCSLKDEDYPDSNRFFPFSYKISESPNKLIQDLRELSKRLEEKLKNG